MQTKILPGQTFITLLVNNTIQGLIYWYLSIICFSFWLQILFFSIKDSAIQSSKFHYPLKISNMPIKTSKDNKTFSFNQMFKLQRHRQPFALSNQKNFVFKLILVCCALSKRNSTLCCGWQEKNDLNTDWHAYYGKPCYLPIKSLLLFWSGVCSPFI